MYFTRGLRSYLNYTELKRQSDLEDAENLYLQALEFENTNPVVKYNLGVLKYYQYQDHLNDEAIACFRQALNCNDRNLRARASSASLRIVAMAHTPLPVFQLPKNDQQERSDSTQFDHHTDQVESHERATFPSSIITAPPSVEVVTIPRRAASHSGVPCSNSS